MMSFRLEILTPVRPFYEGECVSLVIPTTDGMLGIQAGRAPLTAAIRDGQVVFTAPDGEVRVCAVARGMVSVSSARTCILCESALAPDEIDEAAERAALEAAEAELRKKKSYEEYAVSELTLARALNRLKVKHDSAMHPNL